MTEETGSLVGPLGYLAFFVWTVAAAALTEGPLLCGVAAVVVLGSYLLGGDGLRGLRRPRFWWLILALIVSSSQLVGQRDLQLGPLLYSSTGLRTGVWLSLRATCLVLAVDLMARSVSPLRLAELGERWGLPGLGFALGVAVNLLPTMQRILQDAWTALNLRGGLRRQRWRALRLLLVTVTANALDYGDLVLEAATARGFGSERRRRAAVTERHPADLWLAGGLLAMSVLLVVLG